MRATREALASALESALVADNVGACEACVRLMASGVRESRLERIALGRLRKLAHPRYEAAFRSLVARLRSAARRDPARLGRFMSRLDELVALADKRLSAVKR
jgi:hypothetical protein